MARTRPNQARNRTSLARNFQKTARPNLDQNWLGIGQRTWANNRPNVAWSMNSLGRPRPDSARIRPNLRHLGRWKVLNLGKLIEQRRATLIESGRRSPSVAVLLSSVVAGVQRAIDAIWSHLQDVFVLRNPKMNTIGHMWARGPESAEASVVLPRLAKSDRRPNLCEETAVQATSVPGVHFRAILRSDPCPEPRRSGAQWGQAPKSTKSFKGRNQRP